MDSSPSTISAIQYAASNQPQRVVSPISNGTHLSINAEAHYTYIPGKELFKALFGKSEFLAGLAGSGAEFDNALS